MTEPRPPLPPVFGRGNCGAAADLTHIDGYRSVYQEDVGGLPSSSRH